MLEPPSRRHPLPVVPRWVGTGTRLGLHVHGEREPALGVRLGLKTTRAGVVNVDGDLAGAAAVADSEQVVAGQFVQPFPGTAGIAAQLVAEPGGRHDHPPRLVIGEFPQKQEAQFCRRADAAVALKRAEPFAISSLRHNSASLAMLEQILPPLLRAGRHRLDRRAGLQHLLAEAEQPGRRHLQRGAARAKSAR